MRPQLENGYTRIANEILEVVSQAKFNGTQFKIIMIIWRYTYGFNRKDSEFSLNFLSEATNSHKQQVKRELDKLIEDKVIIIAKEAGFNNSRRLAFNKNYHEWNIKGIQYIKKSTVSELADSRVSEKDYTTVSEKDYTTVSGLEYQERQYKDNINKDTTTIEMSKAERENPVADIDADSIQQDALRKIEDFYLTEVRQKATCSGKDLYDMVLVYKKYKDIDFILDVLQSATKENIKRNERCKINSFSYFMPILEERWEDKLKAKEVKRDGSTTRVSRKNFKFDKSQFLWNGGEG